ncbi:probable ubiquinol--cytochrome-c reductase [Pseudozyma flocculosa]|uniref:Cytochrome b-c1 complex subunit 7 n=1 Tax=Pseudozyma flocculosa TaxID=84751 RepID=A0A5C3EVZ5_9BASI|nr:probable ubiquinol--cytochrome-c reductase [Pseudozyma flocculosa]
MVLALSGLSLAKYIQNSPALLRMIKPVANAYAQAAGHRQHGLRYDDLIIEESPRVQKVRFEVLVPHTVAHPRPAIKRLPEREAYDRAYRLRQATQLSVLHRELPKEQWTPASQDKRYLTPYVQEIANEEDERVAWDTIGVKKGH